jgi:flagellin-like hook-associated protein FlgL
MGLRIHNDIEGLSVPDDAAGLAGAQRDAHDDLLLVQTAERTLGEVHSMLRDLKVQYSNGAPSPDDSGGTIDDIDTAIGNVSKIRGELGAVRDRVEHRLSNLATHHENLVASESRIRDVDMASEMVNFTKLQIRQQAGVSMLAQANQAPQSVLSLLR